MLSSSSVIIRIWSFSSSTSISVRRTWVASSSLFLILFSLTSRRRMVFVFFLNLYVFYFSLFLLLRNKLITSKYKWTSKVSWIGAFKVFWFIWSSKTYHFSIDIEANLVLSYYGDFKVAVLSSNIILGLARWLLCVEAISYLFIERVNNLWEVKFGLAYRYIFSHPFLDKYTIKIGQRLLVIRVLCVYWIRPRMESYRMILKGSLLFSLFKLLNNFTNFGFKPSFVFIRRLILLSQYINFDKLRVSFEEIQFLKKSIPWCLS